MIRVRPSTVGDPEDLAPRLRAADIAEIEAACGASPIEGLTSAFSVSDICLTAEIDGKIVAMFGVARDADVTEEIGLSYGNIWYMGSPESVRNTKMFMRESRAWLSTLEAHFDALGNVVDARNSKHISWIKAMGFEFVDTITEYGPEGYTFLRFYKVCGGS